MKLKSVFIALATFLMLGSLTFKLYSAEAIEGNTFAVGTSDEGIQLESNALKPFTDDDISLGTSSLRFKDLHLSGDVAGGADIRSTAFLGIGSQVSIDVSSATTIAVANSYVIMRTTGGAGSTPITMSTEIQQIADAVEGDWLILTSTINTQAITFTRGSTTKLRLGSATRVIDLNDTLFLIFNGSEWHEISFVDNDE